MTSDRQELKMSHRVPNGTLRGTPVNTDNNIVKVYFRATVPRGTVAPKMGQRGTRGLLAAANFVDHVLVFFVNYASLYFKGGSHLALVDRELSRKKIYTFYPLVIA